MSTGKIAAIVVGVLVLILGLVGGCGAMSWYNTGVSLQETTLAQYRDNQNSYDAMWKKIVETAQVPDKFKEDLKTVLVADNTAKFGPNGSGAAFQWFQERQITLAPELYAQVERVIEAGRNDFKQGQTMLLDKQNRLRTHRKGVFGKVCRGFGFDFLDDIEGEYKPPKDMDGDGRYTVLDYSIVTSARTDNAFKTGQDAAVKVFGHNGEM